MTLGRFVVTVDDKLFYDTLRHEVCTEDDLSSRLLIAGQEEQAIQRKLFEPGPFQLLLIPSFECNLRCPQCYVGHLLKTPSGNRIGNTDPEKLISFVQRAQDHLGPLKSLTLVGGEPFLHGDAFRKYLDASIPVGATTNGMFDFNEVKDILGRLQQLTFSIDGWPEQHNRTRKSMQLGTDTFAVTYRNLCRTIAAFPHLSVVVQGAIIDDKHVDSAMYLRYYSLMLGAGVKRENISLGPCAATLSRGPIDSYVRYVRTSTRTSPCCDNLLHKGLVIHGNHVYGSYHRFEELPPLAELDDPIEQILIRRKEAVLNSMLMLQDDTCMRECRAVGVCWGLCSSDRHVFRDNKPSSACDRAFKESKVIQMGQNAIRSRSQ
jgi:sulfatase maturation enzyme AslB (radical SAM superfamily)